MNCQLWSSMTRLWLTVYCWSRRSARTHARTYTAKAGCACVLTTHGLRNATYALSPADPRPNLAFMYCFAIVQCISLSVHFTVVITTITSFVLAIDVIPVFTITAAATKRKKKWLLLPSFAENILIQRRKMCTEYNVRRRCQRIRKRKKVKST